MIIDVAYKMSMEKVTERKRKSHAEIFSVAFLFQEASKDFLFPSALPAFFVASIFLPAQAVIKTEENKTGTDYR